MVVSQEVIYGEKHLGDRLAAMVGYLITIHLYLISCQSADPNHQTVR